MTVQSATVLALAIAGIGGADLAKDRERPPVFLTAVDQAGKIVVQVRGLATKPFAGSYRLDAVSGSNRVHQSGGARLEPNISTTFVSLNLSASGAWSAVLHVEPESGAPYEQRLGVAGS